jgi:tetratricopeptide (TPR) repeat protein
MVDIVEKLTGRKSAASTTAGGINSILFGNTGSLSRSFSATAINDYRIRIGFWPIISASDPEAAMGILVILSLLLERWRSVHVYRLLASLDGVPAAYQWDLRKSQFGVDDWELEGLDENVAIWGSLDRGPNGFSLKLEVESDFSQSDVPETVTRQFKSLAELLSDLYGIAEEIADLLDAGEISPLAAVYERTLLDESSLKQLLSAVFEWERMLWLSLWGVELAEDEMLQQQDKLVTQAVNSVEQPFAFWLVGRECARALDPVYGPLSETLLPTVENVAEKLQEQPLSLVALGVGLFRAGERARAYDLLEQVVELHPDNLAARFTLAELYRAGAEFGPAVATFQRAIEDEIASSALYMRYADLLLFLNANNVVMNLGVRRTSAAGKTFVEDVVLIDTSENEQDLLIREAAEAYREAFALEPDQLEALSQLVLLLIDLDDDDLWPRFERLVALDTDGYAVRAAIEAMYAVSNLKPGLAILQKAISVATERLDLRLNLAVLHLVAEDYDSAYSELEQVEPLVKTPQQRADVERLMLAANDPEFEARFGEVDDQLRAGNSISASDVEFLEDVLDQAPSLAQAYTALASAYNAWGETQDALDVLLDGQKALPEDPEIVGLLARILWESGEHKLAFDYLNTGVKHNPDHVGLLARTGMYLFADGQEESAREFLLLAEALNPSHPTLIEARAYIAHKMGEL